MNSFCCCCWASLVLKFCPCSWLFSCHLPGDVVFCNISRAFNNWKGFSFYLCGEYLNRWNLRNRANFSSGIHHFRRNWTGRRCKEILKTSLAQKALCAYVQRRCSLFMIAFVSCMHWNYMRTWQRFSSCHPRNWPLYRRFKQLTWTQSQPIRTFNATTSPKVRRWVIAFLLSQICIMATSRLFACFYVSVCLVDSTRKWLKNVVCRRRTFATIFRVDLPASELCIFRNALSLHQSIHKK